MSGNMITGVARERGAASLLARVVGHDGLTIQQGHLSAIAYEVWDIEVTPPAKVVSQTEVDIANAIFDTLQNDGVWSADQTGYNLRIDLSAASFPDAHVYRVDVRLTPIVGETFFVPFEVQAGKTYFAD